MKLSRRRVLAGLAAASPAALLAHPLLHVARAYARDRLPSTPRPALGGDASALDGEAIVPVTPSGDSTQTEAALRDLLANARARGQTLSIAGARHSMGGQTRRTGQLQLDTSRLAGMRLEPSGDLVWVQSGARFVDLIRYLDARGASVAVMQSNSDFSLGGSVSVNCHGWQPNAPPIASSVENLRVMLADGSIVNASRDENRELFSLVLGGYGLFGVILDMRLRVTQNRLLARRTFEVGIDEYVARFRAESARANLAFGRLAVAPSVRGERALITVYTASEARELPRLVEQPESALTRAVFRGQVGSDYGKELRWTAERWLGGEGGAALTRNQVMSEPVALFQNRRPELTDILHEYFVSPEQLPAFARRAAALVARHGAELLNVTVRNVRRDDDVLLRYARDEVFGLVMLFCIERSAAADARLGELARALIDVVLELGGSYYLPYRPYATRAQFERAYPTARAFFAAKRRYDPTGLFSSHFFEKYALE